MNTHRRHPGSGTARGPSPYLIGAAIAGQLTGDVPG